MELAAQRRWLDMLDSDPQFSEVKVFGFETVPGSWVLDYPSGLPEHLVYLVVAGASAGEAGGRQVRLGPGSLLWLRPRVPFTFAVASGRAPTLYRFRIGTAQVDDMDSVTVLPDAWDLRAPFDTLIAELGSDLRYRDRRVQASLVLIFTAIFRLQQPRRDGQALDSRQRQRLEEYVDGRITERIQPADLARAIGLAPQYFTRRFRQTYGMPPKVWLVRRRIQHAALRLDESQEPVSLIARRLGYPDVFLFSRQFKTVLGMSPRNYRSR